MTWGSAALIAINVILLLLVMLGLAALMLAGRVERRTIVVLVAIGGLVLLLALCCCGIGAGLVGYFNVQAPAPVPVPAPRVPTPAPLPAVPPATMRLVPSDATIAQGDAISVTVHITGATDLYGVEVHLTCGDGLSASGLVPGTCASDFGAVSRIIDGRVDFVAARMAPSRPLSGDCDVVTFTLTGEKPGTHTVVFDRVILASEDGVALPVTAMDGQIIVEP